MGPSSRPVTFPGAFGTSLAARLDAPAGPPLAYAVFAHCFTCSKESKAARRDQRRARREGVCRAALRFHGLGGSEGRFREHQFLLQRRRSRRRADFLSASTAPRRSWSAQPRGTRSAPRLRGSPRRPRRDHRSALRPEHVLGLIKDSVEKIDAEGDAPGRYRRP